MTIGQKIKQKRCELKISADELGRRLGKDRSTIYRYENGDIENLPLDILEPIAKALGTSPQFLMGWEDSESIDYEKLGIFPIKTKKFRMLGEVACGQPIFANEEYETFVTASADIKADFCLVAKGDSMINARIFDGDVVFIREQPDVENGEIAAVLIGNEVTLKRVYKYPNRLELRPENPMHKVQNYEGEELNNIRILGKAVAFQSYIV